jgi:hypothetical protein
VRRKLMNGRNYISDKGLLSEYIRNSNISIAPPKNPVKKGQEILTRENIQMASHM